MVHGFRLYLPMCLPADIYFQSPKSIPIALPLLFADMCRAEQPKTRVAPRARAQRRSTEATPGPGAALTLQTGILSGAYAMPPACMLGLFVDDFSV